MCKRCVDSVTAAFPNIPDDQVGDFLLSCTAFPLGEPETVERQVAELRQKTDDYRKCLAIVEAEMLAAMAATEREAP